MKNSSKSSDSRFKPTAVRTKPWRAWSDTTILADDAPIHTLSIAIPYKYSYATFDLGTSVPRRS